MFDLWWPNWNIYCYEFWLLTLPVPLTNVLIFLLCFHFSAYRKLARSYHPDVNKWVFSPLLFSLSCGNVCSGWVSVKSELLIGFVRYELFVLDHFSFENLLHMFVIRLLMLFCKQGFQGGLSLYYFSWIYITIACINVLKKTMAFWYLSQSFEFYIWWGPCQSYTTWLR